MLCLFKNSRLSLPFHLLASLISWGSVIYWLYFAFINKAFLENFFSGQALFVDLLFGLPIVLIFAIVIYAFLYWGIKLMVIVFLPQTIIHTQTENELDETLDPALGENYWEKGPTDHSDAAKIEKTIEDASPSSKKDR